MITSYRVGQWARVTARAFRTISRTRSVGMLFSTLRPLCLFLLFQWRWSMLLRILSLSRALPILIRPLRTARFLLRLSTNGPLHGPTLSLQSHSFFLFLCSFHSIRLYFINSSLQSRFFSYAILLFISLFVFFRRTSLGHHSLELLQPLLKSLLPTWNVVGRGPGLTTGTAVPGRRIRLSLVGLFPFGPNSL